MGKLQSKRKSRKKPNLRPKSGNSQRKRILKSKAKSTLRVWRRLKKRRKISPRSRQARGAEDSLEEVKESGEVTEENEAVTEEEEEAPPKKAVKKKAEKAKGKANKKPTKADEKKAEREAKKKAKQEAKEAAADTEV